MVLKGNKTWFLIQQSSYWKSLILKGRIVLNIICLIMAFSLSIVIGGGNIFYYFLDILKIVFVVSTSMALVYFAIADKEDYENWHLRSYRSKVLKEKLLLALLEGVFFLILATALLGIVYIVGLPYAREQDFLLEHLSAYPLRYIPSPVEGILYAFIMLIQLVSPIAGIYWQFSRCTKVIGFDSEKNIFKTEWWLFLYFPFVLLWIFFTAFLDYVYFNLLYPDVFPNFNILEGSIFSEQPYLYLVLQLSVLVVLNLFFFIDGILANKFRKNFKELKI